MLTAHASFQTDLMSLLTGLAAMGRHVSPHLRGFDRPLMLSHAIRMEQMASLLSGSSCGFNAPVKLRLTSELMSRTMVTMKQLDASAIAGIAGLSHSMESAALACARFRGACSSVRKLSDDSAKLFEWANSCIQSIRRLHLMTRCIARKLRRAIALEISNDCISQVFKQPGGYQVIRMQEKLICSGARPVAVNRLRLNQERLRFLGLGEEA